MTTDCKTTDAAKRYHIRRIADGYWLKVSRGKLVCQRFGKIRFGAYTPRGGTKLDAWLARHSECEAVEVDQ